MKLKGEQKNRLRQRFQRLFSAVLLVVVLVQPSVAATFTGVSGMLTVPTADVLPEGAIEGGIRFVDDAMTAAIALGVMPNVEVALNNVSESGGVDQLGLAIKGLVFAETSREPGFAVGFERERAYLVFSKRLAPRFRAHAGYAYGDDGGVFGGASYALNTASSGRSAVRVPATTAMFEYTPKGIHAGARMVFAPSLSVDIGLLDLKDLVLGVSLRSVF